MRTMALALALAVAGSGVPVRAQDAGDLGLGVIVAEPTGLSAKLWLSEYDALDAAAAWSFAGRDALQVHVDYLYHRYDLTAIDESEGRLPIYFGVGARFKVGEDDRGRGDDEDDRLGLRIPVGASFMFARVPFDVFGELVPVLDVVPETDLDLNVGVGGRFYFGRHEQLLQGDTARR